MKKYDINQRWLLSKPSHIFEGFGSGPEFVEVNLPHDAMIFEERCEFSTNGPDAAWYNGATYNYVKELDVPDEWKGKPVRLEFEGIAQNATVYIDDQFVGKCPYAYSDVKFDISEFLNYGEVNTIKVVAKTGMQQISRWYSGSGIIRPAWLLVGDYVQIAPDGIYVTTESCTKEEAFVCCSAKIEHSSLNKSFCRVEIIIKNSEGHVVANDNQPLTLFGVQTVQVRARFCLENPCLWNVDTPNLYTVSVRILDGDSVVDEESIRTGIRTITVDSRHGLRINGESVKLRGGCIHHDNGILGAISLKDAEIRRVRRLKDAGFNAIRSAHNPAAKALLEACDEIGLFVMDEAFDVWNSSKRDHDYSLFFQEWWKFDVRSLVEKDYNHPCVILYSIGNEIPETGSAAGASQNRIIADYLRSQDSSRPLVNCINGMISVMPYMRDILADVLGEDVRELPSDINELMTMFDANIDDIMVHPIVTRGTEETFAGVDVCGYNYMASRYPVDEQIFPNRVIVGSETNPDKIGYNWPVILSRSNVIGDFCWTGWDYIGEAGVGKNDYDLTYEMYGPWPWFLAYCGDFDICGNRRPQSFYREIVFGLRHIPYMAAERPEHYNQEKYVTNWTWPDVIGSWTWPGFEGKPIHVEVYSGDDEVELLVNEESVGRKSVGEIMPYKAIFDVLYRSGKVTAISYTGGVETARTTLNTAGDVDEVRIISDRTNAPADGTSLIYLDISLTDKDGNLVTACDMEVDLSMDGDADLRGFGSANPKILEGFNDTTHTTFDGRAMAVVSSVSPGTVTITASARNLKPAMCKLHFN